MLENQSAGRKIKALTYEQTSPYQGFTPVEVHTAVCRVCSAEPESVGLAREIRTDREAESFAAWADDRGALWTEYSPAKTDELTGGEHSVEIDDRSTMVFKSTHPGKFGAFYEPSQDWLIMDALPCNVLTLEDGSLMPFDVVVVQPSELLKSRLAL